MTGWLEPERPDRRSAGIGWLLILAICGAGAQPAARPDGLDALFETWWSVSSFGELDRAADRTVRTGIVVPQDYDPSQKYAVRVHLHGGIMRPLAEDAVPLASHRHRGGAPRRWRTSRRSSNA
jgi:hypothetical protein